MLTVNPSARAIRSTLNYHSVSELPLTPDQAIIATPPESVPGLIKELGERGCRAAVVITAGFGEGEQADGKALQQAMLEAARPYLMRIVGPNCLGILAPHKGINASFAHLTPLKGDIAFVTQSRAVATSILDWASARGIGFSYIISLGAMSDVDFGDVLDFLALDPKTHSILLYVEAISDARKFLSAARMASRNKPVVVVKAGRSDAGAKAALSHTGALAGSDAIYDAAFRRAGMLRVKTLDELFQAAGTLATGIRVQEDRPAADLEAITLTLIKLSQLASDLERVVELDINPLLADASGVMALDARIVIRSSQRQRLPMAIRPYPKQLAQTITTCSGQAYCLRPIRPEDESALVHMLGQSSPSDVRLRFFAAIRKFDHAFAARLTQIDYDREMAFVAIPSGSDEIVGGVRLSADPDKEKAEFAVMVRSDFKGTGLGYSLMQQIIDFARMNAIKQLFADVLRRITPCSRW